MSGDFRLGNWNVHPTLNRVSCGDRVVRLEPKMMQVLVCLAEHAGDVVTREELIARVWPDVFVTDDVLHRAIRELRRVFGDSPTAPRYIETIRKRGYRLMPQLFSDGNAHAPSPASAGHGEAHAVPVPPEIARSTTSRHHYGSVAPSMEFSIVAASVLTAVVAIVGMVASRGADMAPQAHARFVPMESGPLNETDPAISTDGNRIAFVQREAGRPSAADIFIRNLESGVLSRITDQPGSHRLPAWSPDGTQLAFVRETADGCDIVVRTLSISSERRVAACGNPDEPKMSWSADGAALFTSVAPAAHAGGGPARIARVDLLIGTITFVTAPPAGIIGDDWPVVSPDGRRIAFIRRATGGVSDIYIAPLADGHAQRLTFDDADLTGVDWTGDGRALVYSSDRAGGYSLWRVLASGGRPVLIAGGAARLKHPATDRAGRRVIYENWSYAINIARAGGAGEVDTGITRTADLWNLYPEVSPDGRHLAYVSTESGSHELWVADADGANRRRLTRSEGGVVKSPRWSPSGTHIAYLACGRGGVDVFHVAVASGMVTRVTNDDVNEGAPAWTRDSGRIVFGAKDASGGWQVWSVNVSGEGRRVEIGNAAAAQPGPDGGWFFTRPDRAGVWQTRDDASPVLVVDGVAPGDTHSWVAAADGIYVVRREGDSVVLRRIAREGNEVTVATLTRLSWQGFSVAPDGSVYYARWDRRESNLMSVE